MVTSGGSWHFGGVPTGESVAMLERNMKHSIAGGTGYKIILIKLSSYIQVYVLL